MTCDRAQDLFPDLLVGSLSDDVERELRRHLRGCGRCRRELGDLEEGLAVYARAAHSTEPPAELRERVLDALDEEWRETPSRPVRSGRFAALGIAASIVLIAAAIGWGAFASHRASLADRRAAAEAEDAREYRAFLHALGGESVHVAALSSPTVASMEGSAIVYNGDEGPSWVLLYVGGADGATGTGRAILVGHGERLDLGPVRFDAHGHGSAWIVTREDLHEFDHVRVIGSAGNLIAQGTIGP